MVYNADLGRRRVTSSVYAGASRDGIKVGIRINLTCFQTTRKLCHLRPSSTYRHVYKHESS